jgi:hypothetical protein
VRSLEFITILKDIAVIGSALTALVMLSKMIISLVGAYHSYLDFKKHLAETEHLNDDLKDIKESLKTVEEHCRENYLTGLKLTIMSDEIPRGERIAAGIEYIKRGGNGEIKQFCIDELEINKVIQH